MPSIFKTTSAFCVTALCFALFSSRSASADIPRRTYLWGFQNGCQSMPEADRALEKQLHAAQKEVWLLRSTEGASAPPVCLPHTSAQCGQALQAMCPQVQGQLLGGSIVRGKDVMKMRLWLYSLDTGQVAVLDDFCQSCDVVTALGTQARQLLSEPQFGDLPGPVPLYCQGGHAGSTLATPQHTPLHLLVYGESKHKAFVFAALKAKLAATGRAVLPVTVEAKTYSLDVLQRILGGQTDAQIVGVRLPREGKIGVFVFDGKTEQTADRVLDCIDCEKNKEGLLPKIEPEIDGLLARCFGSGCGYADPALLPKEACEPFPQTPCSGLDTLLRFLPETANRPAAAPPSRLDANTSNMLQALVWSSVGMSAATTLGLFAANSTEAGIRNQPDGSRVGDTLWYPAWTAFGTTLGLATIAIPATVVIRRITTKPETQLPVKPRGPTGPLPIRCPN